MTAPPTRHRQLLTASLVLVTINAGVFAFLAVGIVPYWQSLSGDELQNWFADHFGRFSWMMIPVHLLAIATTVTAFVLERRRAGGSPLIWWIALGGLLASQAFNFTVYGSVLNPDLSSQTLEASDALDTLDTWAALHVVRTTLVVVAAGALAMIITSSDAARAQRRG
ncbi:MAG: DUF1772 domain-containing protein [Actinomycetota bacterium]